MKLYFVRHGRTVWNLEGRFQGASDSPLLPDSIDVLKQLGQHLKKFLLIRFILVIYPEQSNLLRLSKVNSSPLSLKSIPNLREWQLGKLEGLKSLRSMPSTHNKSRPFALIWPSLIRGCLKPNLSTLRLSRTIQFIKSLKESPEKNFDCRAWGKSHC